MKLNLVWTLVIFTLHILKIKSITVNIVLFEPSDFLYIYFWYYVASRQTVQTQIRLLPEEQSDLGLLCLGQVSCPNV